jgi:hypothetical protein
LKENWDVLVFYGEGRRRAWTVFGCVLAGSYEFVFHLGKADLGMENLSLYFFKSGSDSATRSILQLAGRRSRPYLIRQSQAT